MVDLKLEESRFMQFQEKLVSRMESHVQRESDSDCWLWLKSTSGGYGRICLKSDGISFSFSVHRIAYRLNHGSFPRMTVDHLCRNRACCNPAHLEDVSIAVNTLRGIGITARQSQQTHCKRGHELADSNLYVHQGKRLCRSCRFNTKRSPHNKAHNVAYQASKRRARKEESR